MTESDAKKIAALVVAGLLAYAAAPHLERGLAQARAAIGARIKKGAWSMRGVNRAS